MAVSAFGPVLPRLQLETQPAVLLLLDGGLQQQRVEAGAHRLADFLDGELDDLLQHGLELALEERDVHGAVHGVGGRTLGRSLILLRPERDGGRLARCSVVASAVRRLLGLSFPPAAVRSASAWDRVLSRVARVCPLPLRRYYTRTHISPPTCRARARPALGLCARMPARLLDARDTTKRHFGFVFLASFFNHRRTNQGAAAVATPAVGHRIAGSLGPMVPGSSKTITAARPRSCPPP